MMTTLRSARDADISGSEMTFNHLRDVFLAAKTDDRFGELPFLEEQERGNTTDGIPFRDGGVFVNIQLRNRRAAVELRRERVHGRREPATRTAPLCPEVHEHNAALLLIIEVAVSERLDLLGCHSFVSYLYPQGPAAAFALRATVAMKAGHYALRARRRQRTALPMRPTKNPGASHSSGRAATAAGCQTRRVPGESPPAAPLACSPQNETRCLCTFPGPHLLPCRSSRP